jgi:hypothetical protein
VSASSIQATVHIPRGRFMALIAVTAVLAAVCTWVVLTVAFDGGTSGSAANATTRTPTSTSPAVGTTRRPRSIMELTPAQVFAGALGGYALPSADDSSTEAVLASMSPETRRYTARILNLTFGQLAAGAAGSP